MLLYGPIQPFHFFSHHAQKVTSRMILVIFVVITMIIMIIIFKPEGIKDHGEENELAQEGDDQGGGWDDLGQEEEEHCQGEQDGDGQGDLKPGRF